jgi:(R,R)-butanediol dehydrogenase / meso-butanediol dehydrogenase / diacetyl reductase
VKAALWHGRRDLRVEEVPDPTPGAHDVVVEIDWCGICGTDLGEYLYGPQLIPVGEPHPLTGTAAPLIMGHEFAGTVVALGREVRGLRLGMRVGVDTIIFCGHCYWCSRHQHVLCPQLAALGLHAHGGLARFCVAPAYMCLPLPESLSFEAAPLAETLSVVVRALRRGRFQPGETAVIVGAGPVGLMGVQMARVAGASAVYVVEPSAYRRAAALALGADAALDPGDAVGELHELTRGLGADLALECAGGSATVPLAIRLARRGGRAVLIGLPKAESSFNFFELVFQEKEVVGSLSHIYDEDYHAAIRLLGDGRVRAEPLISHRIGLSEIVAGGFERLAGGAEDVLKIIVAPGA